MINIIKSLLSDCDYEYIDTIKIDINDVDLTLDMFKGELVDNQVFLVLTILESQLINDEISSELVVSIANEFRNSNMYESEMDKNTSLVYCVQTDVKSQELTKKKVEIEDDPYYFKKYVFSYSVTDEEQFEQLCYQMNESPLKFVQNYILDTENFSKFKNNFSNETVYRMISDLIIKLPMIPISFDEKKEIRSVNYYMKKIQKCTDLEIEQLDKIITSIEDIDDSDTDLLLDKIFSIWPVIEMEEEHE